MCNTVIAEVISEARKMRSGVGHGGFLVEMEAFQVS